MIKGEISKMKKMTISFILLIILVFSSQVFAGPATNAQQFQAKVVKQALRPDDKQGKAPEIVAEASGEVASDASVKAPESSEPVKTQITVSQQVINQEMDAYKGDLKEIVAEAENSLKKIDAEVKEESDEKTASDKLSAGNDLVAEEKFIEANDAYSAALSAATKPAMRKVIKTKQRAIAPQVKEAECKAKEVKKAGEKAEGVGEKPVVKEDAQKPAAQESAKSAPDQSIQKPAPVKTDEAAMKAQTEKAAKAQAEVEAVAKTASQQIPQAAAITPAATPTVTAPVVVQSPEVVGNVEAIYKEAVAFYWDNKYDKAKAKFEEIRKISPGYARTEYYLGRIKDKSVK